MLDYLEIISYFTTRLNTHWIQTDSVSVAIFTAYKQTIRLALQPLQQRSRSFEYYATLSGFMVQHHPVVIDLK